MQPQKVHPNATAQPVASYQGARNPKGQMHGQGNQVRCTALAQRSSQVDLLVRQRTWRRRELCTFSLVVRLVRLASPPCLRTRPGDAVAEDTRTLGDVPVPSWAMGGVLLEQLLFPPALELHRNYAVLIITHPYIPAQVSLVTKSTVHSVL